MVDSLDQDVFEPGDSPHYGVVHQVHRYPSRVQRNRLEHRPRRHVRAPDQQRRLVEEVRGGYVLGPVLDDALVGPRQQEVDHRLARGSLDERRGGRRVVLEEGLVVFCRGRDDGGRVGARGLGAKDEGGRFVGGRGEGERVGVGRAAPRRAVDQECCQQAERR